MRRHPGSVQYTIRGVPPEVDRILRQRAASGKKSLNQTVLDKLTTATVGRTKKADFSDLVGKWTPDPGFDDTIAAQRRIDWEKWR
jgi:hypothetical protein